MVGGAEVKKCMRYAWEQVVSTAKKVAPYVLIGVGIGAIIHNWIPEDLVVKLLGTGNPFGVFIATVVGIPMYADIFGCIPIAEALLAKGAQLGVVLSFMMGVTTLSLPSMIMLRKAVKPKLLAIFITICTAGIIIVQFLVFPDKRKKMEPPKRPPPRKRFPCYISWQNITGKGYKQV